MLLINSPIITDAYFNKTNDMISTVISAIFVFEALIKSIAHCFIIGEQAYLKDSWNILDFVIVVSSIINWLLDAFTNSNLAYLKGFRAMRALRPLRIISKDEGMKTIINSVLKSIPSLAHVALINLLFLVTFGILGV